MPELKPYRIFVSHAWDYKDDYHRFIELLKNANNFAFRNYSVPEHDPVDAKNNSKLQIKLKDQMEPTQIVIILAGLYVNHSDWILEEIEMAKAMNKPMIGIQPYGSVNTPTIVQNSVKEMVGWSTTSIVGGIRKYAL